jgi:ankyrin repeat protein
LYAWKGDLEIVRKLVARGDDISARDDDHGDTVLDWARRGGHQPIIDYLVSIGATDSQPGTN